MKAWKMGVILLGIGLFSAARGQVLPRVGGREATAQLTGGRATLGNALLTNHIHFDNRHVRFDVLTTQTSPTHLDFFLTRPDGTTLTLSDLKTIGELQLDDLDSVPASPRLADHFSGKRVSCDLLDDESGVAIHWAVELRDKANYERHILTLSSSSPTSLKGVTFNVPISQARTVGSVDGSVIASDVAFAGIEHPMAHNMVENSLKKLASWRPEDLKAGLLTIPGIQADARQDKVSLHFQYTRGSRRLDIHKVELLDGQQVVATDQHDGFTGVKAENNDFTLAIPPSARGRALQARATIGTDLDGFDSFGDVSQAGLTTTATASLDRPIELDANKTFTLSLVIGVSDPGQLRRSFLYYLEQERARAYKPFVHYNSWYDLNIGRPGNRMTEAEALDVIAQYKKQLVDARHVKLDSFVWDDGWDDHRNWGFHDGFPSGFTRVSKAAVEIGAGTGVWMSPWGGYGREKEERLKFGKENGFEINAGGFSMAGPTYYANFRDKTLNFIRQFGVNHFKFDGIGGGPDASGAPASVANDLDALLRLTTELRKEKPDIYINATVGTWPSPFWTRYVDSIWRQGGDHGFAGVGSKRQQWITYRDATVYSRIVQRGPLYPANSVMVHGTTIGERGSPGTMKRDSKDIADEIWMLAGSGTQLQELYITPKLLTPADWDTLAKAIQWVRANQSVLVDTHFVGGDPGSLEVYGYAAWSPDRSVITLRNPSDKPQKYELSLPKALELPADAKKSFQQRAPGGDSFANVENTQTLELEPFEVKILELKSN